MKFFFNIPFFKIKNILFLLVFASTIPFVYATSIKNVGRVIKLSDGTFAAIKFSTKATETLLTTLKNLDLSDDALKVLFKDLQNADFAKTLAENPNLIKTWKSLFDNGINASIRKNPDALSNIANSLKEGLDAIDAIKDAIQTLNKTKWEEIKALFKRGNDFNRKIRELTPNPYQYHEVTVEQIINGKVKKFRLDSYNDGLEIVSRKATDFNNIQTSTFTKYCDELVSKYKIGTKITAPKYPELNGKTLQGSYKLEVPASNQASSKLTEFTQIAQSKGIEIIFKTE